MLNINTQSKHFLENQNMNTKQLLKYTKKGCYSYVCPSAHAIIVRREGGMAFCSCRISHHETKESRDNCTLSYY